MKFEQVLELVDAVSASALTEFKYEEGGVKISMKKASEGVVKETFFRPLEPEALLREEAGKGKLERGNAVEDAASFDASQEVEVRQTVTSPLVGTFYAAPAEDAEPFVNVGDLVKKGQVLAIVEAMKLMNEIESDFSGQVVKILAENGQAVEYGQPLFLIKEG